MIVWLDSIKQIQVFRMDYLTFARKNYQQI